MNKLIVGLSTVCLLFVGCPDDSGPMQTKDGKDGASDQPAAGDSGPPKDAGEPDSEGSNGGAASAYDADEQASTAKLKSCGFYEPSLEPEEYSVEDGFDACVARCVASASCADIEALLCDEDDNAFSRCLDGCDDAPEDGFLCGDGARVPHAMRCDLIDDCDDGKDEEDCGEFVCEDGERIPAKSVRCDAIEDCADGSDEQGCALSCE